MAMRQPDQSVALHAHGFNSVIRYLKMSSLDRVKDLNRRCLEQMKALGLEPTPEAVVAGIPNGSDHSDMGTLINWLSRIHENDADGVAQLQALQATAQHRIDGV